MYLHRYCHVGLLGAALFLTGCDQSITFSPEAEDEKRYWVYSASQNAAQDEIEYRLNSLLHYKMASVDDTVNLHITPEYLDLNKGDKYDSLNSARSRARSIQVFQSGFNLEVDKKSGTLLSLTGRDSEKWPDYIKRYGEDHPLLNTLRHHVSIPGLQASLSTEVGDIITLSQFFGIPATLTVTQVTSETVSATVEGNMNNRQLYAQLTVERENGWIDSLYAVDMKDDQSTHFIAIQPEENLQHIADPHPVSIQPDSFWRAIAHTQDTPLTPHVITKEALFPYTSGIISGGRYPYFSASIVHDLAQTNHSGNITLTDFKAQNKAGKDADLSFVAPTNGHYFDIHKNSVNGVLLTGWNHRDTLKQTRSATATAHYYPDIITPYKVQWRKGEAQTFTLGDITLNVTPYPQRTGEYQITYNRGASNILLTTFDGLKGDIEIKTLAAGPEWLTDAARFWLAHVGDQTQAMTTANLKLTEESDTVTFYLKGRESHPLYSETVMFIPKRHYAATATLPPIDGKGPYNRRALSDEEKQEAEAIRQRLAERYAITPFSDITADMHHPNAGTLYLPMGWGSICQADVVNDVEINGNGLIWQGRTRGPFPAEAFQLMTEDGVKKYFYDLTVETRLQCKGSPQWQAMPDVIDRTYPWLVDLSLLPKITADQPIHALFEQYRFNGDENDRLWLLDRKGEDVHRFDRLLSSILHDGKYLKFSGSIVDVSQLQATGESQEKTWITTFPPLPKG
ncbi:hypothetical protein L4C36_18565 [Photobacterium japonica]|uniref:hypothetical protein n=1 Tax=Photobacterium japonica TaxID=2910235 RepID=UPI003D0F1247